MKEDEIQERIQQGEEMPGPDGEAYRKVFHALRREPGFVLPSSFADRVVRHVVAKPKSSNDMFWLYMGLASCLLAAAVAVWITGIRISFPVPGFVREYPRFVVLGILFVLSFHWLDSRVAKKIS